MSEELGSLTSEAKSAVRDDPDTIGGPGDTQATDPAVVAFIIQLFEVLLPCDHVTADDDFFDCGGDSIQAVTLLLEIERRTGRRLPSTIIYEARTPAALASILNERRVAPETSPLVLLKPGGTSPPAFVVHGIGGHVMELWQLGRLIRTDRPIYGVQGCGPDGASASEGSIKEMAARYLELIRMVQPTGPYFLAGYSFGGLVALEMARNLLDAGAPIGLLALLDSFPAPWHWPLSARVRWMMRRTGHHVGEITRLRPRQMIPSAMQRMQAFGHKIGVLQAPRDVTLITALQQAWSDNARALWRYRPLPYPGRIDFLYASANADVVADPAAVWGGLVGQLVIHPIRTTHTGLIRTEVNELAARLSSLLDKSASPGSLADASSRPPS